MIHAKLTLTNTDNEEVVICIRETTAEKKYEVFVHGGFLADGSDSAFAYTFEEALVIMFDEANQVEVSK